MPSRRPLSLKIDVDTHDGMKDGVPVLLEILQQNGVRATFCLSYGPDNAGRAIFRVLRDPAFLKKMLCTGAPGLYGWRTVLSGTLLPARPIASAFPELVRKIAAQGHEVAVHAWDHRRWQDHLDEMTESDIRGEFRRSFSAHENILDARPRAVAAPGWQATPLSLAVEDSLGLEWASDLRGGPPCRLKVRGHVSSLLQIPTTGPCIEELLTDGVRGSRELSSALTSSLAQEEFPVLAVHAEVEGGRFAGFFSGLLPALLENHGEIITLGAMARRIRAGSADIPVRTFTTIMIPGRAGRVASSA